MENVINQSINDPQNVYIPSISTALLTRAAQLDSMVDRLGATEDAAELSLDTVCRKCSRIVAASGAAISIRTGTQHGPSSASDPWADAMEELQYVLGEGPSLDAFSRGGPVLTAELVGGDRTWSAFAPAARAKGLGAVFAFPLQLAGRKLGVLSLYRRESGSLGPEEFVEGLLLSDALTCLVLASQAQAPSESLARPIDDIARPWAVVHKAAGMIAVQLTVSVDEALRRLRAFSATQECSIKEVAGQVLSRQLRFEPEPERCRRS
jgi:hypothetical protein